ncbi:unnamed protein product [Ixodes pacificus]
MVVSASVGSGRSLVCSPLHATFAKKRSRVANELPPIVAHLAGSSEPFLTCTSCIGVHCRPVLTIAVAKVPLTSCLRPPKQLQLRSRELPYSNCARLGFSQLLEHLEFPCKDFADACNFLKNSTQNTAFGACAVVTVLLHTLFYNFQACKLGESMLACFGFSKLSA